FESGSVTKTWTGMLFADMIATGDVRPTDTLDALLPGRTFTEPDVGNVTLEELASQRSGLPRLAPGGPVRILTTAIASLRGTDPYLGADREFVLDALGR